MGERKVVNFPDPKNGELINEELLALAVDSEDNVYAIRWLRAGSRTRLGKVSIKSYVMYVLDKNYNFTYKWLCRCCSEQRRHLYLTLSRKE